MQPAFQDGDFGEGDFEVFSVVAFQSDVVQAIDTRCEYGWDASDSED